MSDFEVSNAVIESADLFINDKGILDCWLSLDYGGTGQGFGGYALYLPKSFDHWRLETGAGHFIYRVLQVAGVEDFSKLKGRTIRARHTWTEVEAIGHIVKDDWFFPKRDFAKKEAA